MTEFDSYSDDCVSAVIGVQHTEVPNLWVMILKTFCGVNFMIAERAGTWNHIVCESGTVQMNFSI